MDSSGPMATKAPDRFMNVFWDLASLDPSARNDAAVRLCKYLGSIQRALVNSGQLTLTSPTSQVGRHDPDAPTFPELSYALKRLIRGLASTRDAARPGFALALSEVLINFPIVRVEDVLRQLFEEHPVSNSVKGQEERDHLYGRIFGIGAILRSGRINSAVEAYSHGKDDTNLTAFMNDVVVAIINELFTLSEKKHFVTELCYQLVISLIFGPAQLPKSVFTKYLVSALAPKLTIYPYEYTPEHLWLALAVNHAYGYDMHSNVPEYWEAGNIIQASHLSMLKTALMSAAVAGEARVHSLWDFVLRDIIGASDATAVLQDFFKIIVDELFVTSNNNRFMAFKILEKTFPMLQSSQVPLVLTPNCLRCILASLSRKNNYMRPLARHIVNVLERHGRSSPMMALAVVTSLQAASNDKFDKATGSRTVHNLLGMLDVPSAVEYIKSLVDHFYTIDVSTAAKMKAAEDAMDVDEGEEENPDTTVQIDEAQANEDLLNSRRLWAVNQIYSIARGKGPITEREDIIFAVLKFLFFHGFYELEDNEEEEEEPKKDKKGKKNTPKKEKKIEDNPPLPLKRQLVPALSEQVQQVCQERFFTLLGQLGASGKIHAGANASEEEKAAILESEEKAGRMSNGNLWVYALAKYQIEVLDKDQTITAVADLDDDEVVEARAAALTFVEDIRAKRVAMESEKVNETDKVKLQARRQRLRHLRAFELLLSHLLVQVNVDPVETAQYIQDLIQSYNKIFETKKSKKDSKSPKKSKKAAEDEEDAEESGPIEVVTDILVGLLFKPSAILRDVVELVFKNVFCDQLTPAALKVLVDSIKADPASLLGGGDDDEDEFDSEEEEDEEDGEEDEHEHEHEHSEEDSKKGKHAHKHDHDTKGSKSTPDKKKGKGKEESSSDSDDDDDEDDDGEAPQLTVAVPFVEGGDDDSDEGMTDEQMFAMDKQIISVLKANKDEKRKHKDTQQQVMHFKFRVLDLLDVFLKRQGTNPLVFEILWPLLQVIQKTAVNRQQGSLLQRISSTFNNKLCKNKVYPRGQDVDADALNALIPKFFDIAVKTRTASVIENCSNAIAFLIRVLAGQAGANNERTWQAGSLDIDVFAKAFEKALKEYGHSHKTLVKAKFFQDIMQRHPALAWKVAPAIPVASEEGRAGFPRAQIFQLLNVLLTKGQVENSENLNTLFSMSSALRSALVACLNDNKIKTPHMRPILKIVVSVVKTLMAQKPANQVRALWDDGQSLSQTLVALLPEWQRSQAMGQHLQTLITFLRGSDAPSFDTITKAAPKKPEYSKQTKPPSASGNKDSKKRKHEEVSPAKNNKKSKDEKSSKTSKKRKQADSDSE